MHQRFGKLFVNTVITSFVCICKSRLRALFDADVVQFVGMCIEHYIDISQAVFLSDVGEDHAGHLIPALEILGSVIALVFVDNTLKLVSGQQTQKLCKDIRFVRHDSISVRLSAIKPSFY